MNKQQREMLINKLVEADIENCMDDRQLFEEILRDGHKGYNNMSGDDLMESFEDEDLREWGLK